MRRFRRNVESFSSTGCRRHNFALDRLRLVPVIRDSIKQGSGRSTPASKSPGTCGPVSTEALRLRRTTGTSSSTAARSPPSTEVPRGGGVTSPQRAAMEHVVTIVTERTVVAPESFKRHACCRHQRDSNLNLNESGPRSDDARPLIVSSGAASTFGTPTSSCNVTGE